MKRATAPVKEGNEGVKEKLCFMVYSLAYLEGRRPNHNKGANAEYEWLKRRDLTKPVFLPLPRR